MGEEESVREGIGERARQALSSSLTEMKRSGVTVMEKLPCKEGGGEGEMEESK